MNYPVYHDLGQNIPPEISAISGTLWTWPPEDATPPVTSVSTAEPVDFCPIVKDLSQNPQYPVFSAAHNSDNGSGTIYWRKSDTKPSTSRTYYWYTPYADGQCRLSGSNTYVVRGTPANGSDFPLIVECNDSRTCRRAPAVSFSTQDHFTMQQTGSLRDEWYYGKRPNLKGLFQPFAVYAGEIFDPEIHDYSTTPLGLDDTPPILELELNWGNNTLKFPPWGVVFHGQVPFLFRFAGNLNINSVHIISSNLHSRPNDNQYRHMAPDIHHMQFSHLETLRIEKISVNVYSGEVVNFNGKFNNGTRLHGGKFHNFFAVNSSYSTVQQASGPNPPPVEFVSIELDGVKILSRPQIVGIQEVTFSNSESRTVDNLDTGGKLHLVNSTMRSYYDWETNFYDSIINSNLEFHGLMLKNFSSANPTQFFVSSGLLAGVALDSTDSRQIVEFRNTATNDLLDNFSGITGSYLANVDFVGKDATTTLVITSSTLVNTTITHDGPVDIIGSQTGGLELHLGGTKVVLDTGSFGSAVLNESRIDSYTGGATVVYTTADLEIMDSNFGSPIQIPNIEGAVNNTLEVFNTLNQITSFSGEVSNFEKLTIGTGVGLGRLIVNDIPIVILTHLPNDWPFYWANTSSITEVSECNSSDYLHGQVRLHHFTATKSGQELILYREIDHPIQIANFQKVEVLAKCRKPQSVSVDLKIEATSKKFLTTPRKYLCTASPLLLQTGENYYSSVDLVAKGRYTDFSVERLYFGRSSLTGEFGASWQLANIPKLVRRIGAENSLFYQFDTGIGATIEMSSNNFGTVKSDDGMYSLTSADGIFEVFDVYGTRWFFLNLDTSPHFTIEKIQYASHILQFFHVENRLIGISEGPRHGSSLYELVHLSYNQANLVEQISFRGRQNTYYIYDGLGRLIEAQTDGVTRYSYTYLDSLNPFQLSEVRGPSGQIWYSWQVDEYGKVTGFTDFETRGLLVRNDQTDELTEVIQGSNYSLSKKFIISPESGQKAQLAYYSDAQLLRTETFEYSALGQMVSQIENGLVRRGNIFSENGNVLTRAVSRIGIGPEYSHKKEFQWASYPAGLRVSTVFEFDNHSDIGVLTKLDWTDSGLLSKVVSTDSGKVFEYSDTGLLTKVFTKKFIEQQETDTLDYEIAYQDDIPVEYKFGRFGINGQRLSVNLTYDDWMNVVSERYSNGLEVYCQYSNVNRPLVCDWKDSQGNVLKVEIYTWEGDLLTGLETGNGAYRSFNYDPFNRLRSIDFGNGIGLFVTWNAQNLIEGIRYSSGDFISFDYDSLGRRVNTYTPTFNQSCVFDDSGLLQTCTNNDGVITTVASNPDGTLGFLESQDSSGASERYDYLYGPNRAIRAVNDSYGNQFSHLDYDKQYLKTNQLIDSLGRTVYEDSRSYYPSGELQFLSTPLETIHLSDSMLGRLTVNSSIHGFSQFDLDETGSVIHGEFPNGFLYRIERDAMGRPISMEIPGGVSKFFRYDIVGNLTRVTSEINGIETRREHHEFNPLNRPVYSTFTDLIDVGNDIAIYYEYDAQGRLVSLNEVYNGVNVSSAYHSYTIDGQRIRTLYPSINIRIERADSGSGAPVFRSVFNDSEDELLMSELFQYGNSGRIIKHYSDITGVTEIGSAYLSDSAEFVSLRSSSIGTAYKHFALDGRVNETGFTRTGGLTENFIKYDRGNDGLSDHSEMKFAQSNFYDFQYYPNKSLKFEDGNSGGNHFSTLYEYFGNELAEMTRISGGHAVILSAVKATNWGNPLIALLPKYPSVSLSTWLENQQTDTVDDFGRLTGSIGIFGDNIVRKKFQWDLLDRLDSVNIYTYDLIQERQLPDEYLKIVYYPASRLIQKFVHSVGDSEVRTTIVVRDGHQELITLDGGHKVIHRLFSDPTEWDRVFAVSQAGSSVQYPQQAENGTVVSNLIQSDFPNQIIATDTTPIDGFGRPYQAAPAPGYVPSFQARPYLAGGLYDFRGRVYDSCIGSFPQADPMLNGTDWFQFNNNNPYHWTDPSGYFANRPLETWPDETEHGAGGNYVDVLIGEFRGFKAPGHAAIGVQYEGQYSVFSFNPKDLKPFEHLDLATYLRHDHDFRHTYRYTLNSADIDPKKVLDGMRNYPSTGYDVTTNNCAISSSRGLQAGGLPISNSITAQGLEQGLLLIDQFRRTHGGARTGLNPLIIDTNIHYPTYKQLPHEKLFK